MTAIKKTIRIEIAIEKEFTNGLRGEMIVSDMIFTDYSHLFKIDDILANYKIAIKKLEGFTMLTATSLVYESGNYLRSNQDIISSFRYVNRYGEVKRSNFNGDSYNNFVETDVKTIISSIKEMVEKGNNQFIEILKNNN